MSASVHDPGTSQMPLAGTVVCCTAVPPELRTELGAIGAQMGATIKLDLTSDVTHLVVGSIDSAKYRYVAKSREDVKVLQPDWLKALRSVWMEGGDVDVAALEAEYRLPTFHGLKICLTGFEDPEQRKHIQETVLRHGAEYHGDLTKAVTHLIAASPSGKKYEHAASWQITIVALEWFEQSLARGMALDERYFDPRLLAEERGRGAWDRQHSMSPMLGKRVREIGGDAANPLRRKLRRSASTKLGSQSEALWAGIITGTTEQRRNEEDEWTDANVSKSCEPPTKTSLPQAVEVTHVAVEPSADPASTSHGPFVDDGDGIFAGRLVFPSGFDRKKTQILCDHLDGNGAEVINDPVQLSNFSSDDLTRGYLVVPHDVPVDHTTIPERAGNLTLVTNWWVERCIHGKRLVDPTESVLCRPFEKLSVSGFDNLTINLTGFTGIELLQVTKAVALFGAVNDDFLSSKISVMICNNRKPNPDKFKYAIDKRIPAVHASWLWECIRSGRVQPYDDYLLRSTSHPQQPKPKPQAPLPVEPTAPLSKEDSLELQKKIESSKSAKARGGLKRAGTLELSLSGPPTPVSTTASTNTHNESSLDHEAQLPSMCDGSTSFPLQDINPNSPRRPSPSNSTSNLKPVPAQRGLRRAKEPSPDCVIPAATDSIKNPVDDERSIAENTTTKSPPRETDYSDMMFKLLANRTNTAGSVINEEESGRRKRRPLGRAQSTRSELSTAEEHDPPAKDAPPPLPEDPAISVLRNEPKVSGLPQPSQELGWDSPGAMEAREKMIRAVGGKVEGRAGGPVAGGLVKDKAEAGGAGQARSMRRKK